MELLKIKKQKKQIMLLYVMFLVLIVSVFVFFVIFQRESFYAQLIFILVLFPVFGLSLFFKPKIEYLNNRYYLLLLLEEDIKPLKYKQNVFKEGWAQGILTKGKYLRHIDNNDYVLLYKVIKDPYKPKKKRYQTLEVILIHKHKNVNFYLDEVNQNISKLQEEHLKQFTYKSVVLLQFMEVDDFNTEVSNKVKDATYLKQKNTYYLTLNIAINTKSKQALYVDGENKMFINYFSYGLKLIETYIN